MKIQRASREGPFRMHWRDGSYTDFPSREAALHSAGDPLAPADRAQRLDDETTVLLKGSELAAAVRTRRVASLVYESIRLDPRRLELDLQLHDLAWDVDDAVYHFSGARQYYEKRITRDALLSQQPDSLADAVFKDLRMEMGFRGGEWGTD